MPIPHLINLFHNDMTAWGQDLHAQPELGFEEHRTSEFVAGKLAEFGCEVHRNIGKTGVVGVLRTGNGPSIGLRADMDALPIQEANDVPYRSKHEGIMHACGHDGHTSMLLGAARYLAETRPFREKIATTIRHLIGPFCIRDPMRTAGSMRGRGDTLVMLSPRRPVSLFYWPPTLGSDCKRVTGGGFHLPVSASDLGA
jgi:hypothetical protein